MGTPVIEATMEIGTLAQWASATATFIAVLVALFKDEMLRWWRKPKLSVSINLASPDCHKTILTYIIQKEALTKAADCYYLRMWVTNNGRTRAERVQVFASKLSRKSADGSFKSVEAFLPMNLSWAHGHQPGGAPEIFAEGISPMMGKHCDLGHVMDPAFRKDIGEYLAGVSADQTILSLDLEVKPNTLSHLISPGVYRLELRVAAANSAPVTKVFEITITGKWFEEQAKMFTDGLGLRAI